MKNRFLLQQDLSLFAESNFCDRKEYREAYAKALEGRKNLEKKGETDLYSFLRVPFLPIEEWIHLRKGLEDVTMILVLGASSSTCTLRALASTLQSWVWVDGGRPRLCFLDELDPEVFWEIMSVAHPKTTGLMVFSPHGKEEAILLQLMRCLEYWHGLVSIEDLRRHVVLITGVHESPLRSLADFFSLPCLAYPPTPFPGVHCFSAPFLLPLQVAGFHPASFAKGAAITCAQFFTKPSSVALEGATLLWIAHRKYGIFHHGIHANGSLFSSILPWMQQLQGIFEATPYAFVRDAPNNVRCFFTIFFERHGARERLVPDFWKELPVLESLAQTSLLQCLHQERKVFCRQRAQEGHFVRMIEVVNLHEATLGALLMNQMLETLLLEEMFAS